MHQFEGANAWVKLNDPQFTIDKAKVEVDVIFGKVQRFFLAAPVNEHFVAANDWVIILNDMN